MKKVIIRNIDKIKTIDLDEESGMKHIIKGEKLEVSDGSHTFDELYEHRVILFIALCKTIVMYADYGLPNKFRDVWRSKKHKDGSMYQGWFIMGIGEEKGEQITYHLPMRKWKKTNFAETLKTAPEFDGHTAQDVLQRLKDL